MGVHDYVWAEYVDKLIGALHDASKGQSLTSRHHIRIDCANNSLNVWNGFSWVMSCECCDVKYCYGGSILGYSSDEHMLWYCGVRHSSVLSISPKDEPKTLLCLKPFQPTVTSSQASAELSHKPCDLLRKVNRFFCHKEMTFNDWLVSAGLIVSHNTKRTG